jgi:hypothetical protein
VTRGVDDLLADLAEAADAAAELVSLGKKRWDTERPLRLAGEAVIGRLGDIATKLPDEVIKATPEIPWREVKGMRSSPRTPTIASTTKRSGSPCVTTSREWTRRSSAGVRRKVDACQHQGVDTTARSASSLIMPYTCPNWANHDRVNSRPTRSHRMGQVAGGLDS